jgi:hypothetical protein
VVRVVVVVAYAYVEVLLQHLLVVVLLYAVVVIQEVRLGKLSFNLVTPVALELVAM